MDKAWVWLPRNSLEYEAGATKFVVESARSLGNPSEMFCPCLLCRNVCHQSMDTVVEHLVIKGMDEKYKRLKCWSLHGDIRNDKTTNVDSSENEAYELFRTTFMATEGTQPSQQQNVDEVEDIDSQEDSEFSKKLEDAETPLYSTCLNYTKVSAIMGLYRIKVKSGMSENFFDQLLMLLHDMLPGDNVLPKSTDDIKKFLKLFGFGYDEKIKSIDSEMDSTSANNIREDVVSQVLGKDRPGRLRGMGRGATITRMAFLQAKDSQVKELEAKLHKLETVVSHLAANKSNDVSKSGLSDVSKGGIRCQILDWCSKDDIVVGEGEYCSCEPTYKIGRIPIGPNVVAVLVNSVSVIGASVWRPTQSISSLGEAVGVKIAWPSDRIILDGDNFTQSPNIVRSEASDGSLGRVHIFDYWNVDTDVIAEGIVLSFDPKEMVNNAPLGPNAAVLNVDKVVKPDAYLWRPTRHGSSLMGDALNETIAWPADRIQIPIP